MIPALLIGRAGSSGFPNKNITPILGRPLMVYPILVAQNSKYVDKDKIYLSTDSGAMKEIGASYGCQLIDRPDYLATNEALAEDAFIHGFEVIRDSNTEPIEFIVLLFCNGATITPGIIDKGVEEVAPDELQAAVVTSFEVLEHLYSPADFLGHIYEVLLPGGLLIFTTLTISGWDLQVLWDQSKSISPPHHINLLSTEGLEKLVRRVGFWVEEIVTPGKLDVDIVRNMLAENPALSLPRFASYLLRRRDDTTWQAFQEFLQKHRLSSHVRVVARKV